jgi:hypothetical protein
LDALNARREFSIEFFPRGEFPAAKHLGGHRGFARDLQAGRTGTLLMTPATEIANPAFRIACMLLPRSEMRMTMDFISVKGNADFTDQPAAKRVPLLTITP